MFKVIPTLRIPQLVIVNSIFQLLFHFIHRSFSSSFGRSLSVPPLAEVIHDQCNPVHSWLFFIWVLLSARLAYTFVLCSALPQLYIIAVCWEQDRQGFRLDRSSSVNAVKSNPFTSGNPIRKPLNTLYTVLCTLIGDYLKTVFTVHTKNISKSQNWLLYENDSDVRYLA